MTRRRTLLIAALIIAAAVLLACAWPLVMTDAEVLESLSTNLTVTPPAWSP